MLHALRSLILALPVVLVSVLARADAPPAHEYVQLELVFDHSSSMFTPRQGENNVSIQRHAVDQFLATYSPDHCINVQVTYVPWGDVIGQPATVMLADMTGLSHLAALVRAQSFTDRGGTEHGIAFRDALKLLDPQASKRIMIFTTDEGNRDEKRDEGLYLEAAQKDVTVYGISLGDADAKYYIATEVVPDARYRFHANTSAEFALALSAVFADIAAQFCLF